MSDDFSFDSLVSEMEASRLLDYLECGNAGKWWEPPLSWDHLTRACRASTHHPSALQVKINILVSTYRPHPLLPLPVFRRFVSDFLMFGNAYLLRTDNKLGKPLSLSAPLAKYVRRGLSLDQYYWCPLYNQAQEYPVGAIHHLINPDPNQEVYGLPDYLAALSSTWLNESATLFRRKYYKNGSHAGFILYLSDTVQNEEDIKNIRQELRESKGPGNFRNMFIYAPNGKKDGIQVIPISEIAARDDFPLMKNVTRDDQLAAHRVPPQLMGIIPNNTGGFGDASMAAQVFFRNEILPLQQTITHAVNSWLAINLTFEPYTLT